MKKALLPSINPLFSSEGITLTALVLHVSELQNNEQMQAAVV